MARKRPAPTELRPNELKLPVVNRYTAFASASEVANHNGINSPRTVQNRSTTSMLHGQQLQQHHHQQQTLVKTSAKNLTAMAASSSSSTMTSTSTKTTSSAEHPIQSKPHVNHWQDELMNFSTQITRQAHFTLGRIANYFRANGMKFDADLRNHFLYISNNR